MMKRQWLNVVGIAFLVVTQWCQAAMPLNEVQRSQASRQFFGDQRGNYILPDRFLYEQLGEALSGPPDPEKALPDGATLVSGCRYRSCTEKGAVVFASDGAVQAAGLIHRRCGEPAARKGSPRCELQTTFTLFEPERGSSAEAVEAIQAWARDKMESAVPEVVTVPST